MNYGLLLLLCFFSAPELFSLCALSLSLPIVLKKWWTIRMGNCLTGTEVFAEFWMKCV